MFNRACDPCIILSDDFSIDDLADRWNVRSGTWTLAASPTNTLTLSAGGGLIRCEIAGDTGHGNATVSAKTASVSTTMTLVGSYVDDNNYLRLEVFVFGGSSTIKLFQKVAGTDTQLGSTVTFTAATNTYYSLFLCWTGVEAIGGIVTVGRCQAAYTGTGNKAGLAGATNAVTFQNFSFSRTILDNATCALCGGTCNCERCTNSATACEFQVDIGNLAGLTGTYILTRSGTGCAGTVTFPNCVWTYSLTACNGNAVCMQLVIVAAAPSGYDVRFEILCSTAGGWTVNYQFGKHFASLPDCLHFSAMSLTLEVAQNGLATCNHTSMCSSATPTANATSL